MRWNCCLDRYTLNALAPGGPRRRNAPIVRSGSYEYGLQASLHARLAIPNSSMGPKSTPPHSIPEVRKGQGDVQLERPEFDRRFREQFYDPAFRPYQSQIQQ